MAPKTRLDPVVDLRERKEKDARVRLAGAIRETADARQRLLEARRHLASPPPRAENAALQAVADAGRARLLEEIQRYAEELDRAAAREDRLRAEYVAAHQAAEAVRRVRDARRRELQEEEARRERRQFDELAALRFSRNS